MSYICPSDRTLQYLYIQTVQDYDYALEGFSYLLHLRLKLLYGGKIHINFGEILSNEIRQMVNGSLMIIAFISINKRVNPVQNLSESLSQIQEQEFDYTLFIRKFTYFICFVANLTVYATESTGKNTFLQ